MKIIHSNTNAKINVNVEIITHETLNIRKKEKKKFSEEKKIISNLYK